MSTSVAAFQRFYSAQNDLRLRGPGAGLGLTINRRIAASREAAGSDRRRARADTQPRAARNLQRSDYLLIVDADASFATELTSQLAAVGVATLRASDSSSTKQLLAHRVPPPVVIDLRYAWLPVLAAVAVKP